MKRKKLDGGAARSIAPVDAQAFLELSGIEKTIASYGRNETIFTQGEVCERVVLD